MLNLILFGRVVAATDNTSNIKKCLSAEFSSKDVHTYLVESAIIAVIMYAKPVSIDYYGASIIPAQLIQTLKDKNTKVKQVNSMIKLVNI